MQDDPNRKDERRPPAGSDGPATVETSIRRAFLVHMDEQQRQFPTAVAVAAPRSNGRSEAKRR